jgi:hypothetical protein
MQLFDRGFGDGQFRALLVNEPQRVAILSLLRLQNRSMTSAQVRAAIFGSCADR